MTTSGRYLRTLSTDPSEISEVRDDVRGIAAASGFSNRAGDVALALDELISNAQEHGGPPIEVSAWSDGRLIIVVIDHGEGFNTEEVWPDRPPRHAGDRGRGLWIVRQLADRVAISSNSAGTRARMEFTIDPGIGA